MLGDYSEFENICKVLVCNELVKCLFGICLIVFQHVSHSSCAPAVADDDHAAEDHGGGKDFLPGEGVHSDGDAYDYCYDRLDVAIHADQGWTDPFLRHRDQKVCDEGGAYDQICEFCVLC